MTEWNFFDKEDVDAVLEIEWVKGNISTESISKLSYNTYWVPTGIFSIGKLVFKVQIPETVNPVGCYGSLID